MPWLVIAFGILLLLIGLCILFALPMVKRHLVRERHSPAEYQLAFDEVSFSTRDGIALKGWWIPCLDSDSTVILLHGYAGSLDPDLKYAPHLHAAGFNILMFDFRAHGRSAGTFTSLGARETEDVHAAVQFTLKKGCSSIGLLGFSMGGRAAILAAPYPPQVRALISDGGPVHLLNAISAELALRKIPYSFSWLLARMILIGASILTGVNLFKQDLDHAAHNLDSIPALFIHGAQDAYTTMEEFNSLASRAGPNASSWVVPEAKHRNIEDTRPEEYLQKVIAFFTRYR